MTSAAYSAWHLPCFLFQREQERHAVSKSCYVELSNKTLLCIKINNKLILFIWTEPGYESKLKLQVAFDLVQLV